MKRSILEFLLDTESIECGFSKKIKTPVHLIYSSSSFNRIFWSIIPVLLVQVIIDEATMIFNNLVQKFLVQ